MVWRDLPWVASACDGLEWVLGSQPETGTRLLSGAFTAPIQSRSLAGNPSPAPSHCRLRPPEITSGAETQKFRKSRWTPGLTQPWPEAPGTFPPAFFLSFSSSLSFQDPRGIISAPSIKAPCNTGWQGNFPGHADSNNAWVRAAAALWNTVETWFPVVRGPWVALPLSPSLCSVRNPPPCFLSYLTGTTRPLSYFWFPRPSEEWLP